ncbi:hypothetical protein ABVN80_06190 [Acinetobacter baumannii]
MGNYRQEPVTATTQTRNFYQLQNQERRVNSYTCSLIFTCYDWQYRTATKAGQEMLAQA